MSPYSYDLSEPEVAKATGFTTKRQGRLLRRARDMNAQQSSVLPDDVSYSTHIRIRTCALQATKKLSCHCRDTFASASLMRKERERSS